MCNPFRGLRALLENPRGCFFSSTIKSHREKNRRRPNNPRKICFQCSKSTSQQQPPSSRSSGRPPPSYSGAASVYFCLPVGFQEVSEMEMRRQHLTLTLPLGQRQTIVCVQALHHRAAASSSLTRRSAVGQLLGQKTPLDPSSVEQLPYFTVREEGKNKDKEAIFYTHTVFFSIRFSIHFGFLANHMQTDFEAL